MICFYYVEQILERTGLNALLSKRPSHSPFGRMDFETGAILHARGAQHGGKFIRGHGGHRVKADEAQLIPDGTMTTAILPMLTDHDGQIDKSGTPWGRGHFYQSYRAGERRKDHEPEPGCFSSHATTYENRFVSRAWIDRMKKKMSEIQFRTEYLAEWCDEIGRVFPFIYIEQAYDLDKEIPKGPFPDREYIAGWDLAKHIDWTVGYVLDVTNPERVELVYSERFQKETWEYVIHRIEEVSKTYGCSQVVVDATTMGDPILERLRMKLGAVVVPFKFTADSKMALINNLRIVLERGQLKFNYDENLVFELFYYEYELSKRSEHVLMGTQQEHDDCVVALALAAWGFSQSYSESRIGLVGQPFSGEAKEPTTWEEAFDLGLERV